MGDVEKFEPAILGENAVLEPDFILEKAKEIDLERVVVIGQMPDGEMYVAGSHGVAVAVVLMERGKFHLLFEDGE